MNFQLLTVGLAVVLSFAYAAWTLMPQALRAALARGLLRLPLPAHVRQRLMRVATASAGCGCDGCDKAPVRATDAATSIPSAQVQPLVFHPRQARK